MDGAIVLGSLHEDLDGSMLREVKLVNEKNSHPKSETYLVDKDTAIEDGKNVKKGDLIGTYEGPGFLWIGGRKIKPEIFPVGVKVGEDVEVVWEADLFGSDGLYYTLRFSGMFGVNSNPDFYNLAGINYEKFELVLNDAQDDNPIRYENRKDLDELKGLGMGKDEFEYPNGEDLSRRLSWFVVNDMKSFRSVVHYMLSVKEDLEKMIYDINCERETRGYSEIM